MIIHETRIHTYKQKVLLSITVEGPHSEKHANVAGYSRVTLLQDERWCTYRRKTRHYDGLLSGNNAVDTHLRAAQPPHEKTDSG